MPYKSDMQRRYINFKAKTDPKMAKVAEEFNEKSKGLKLPEKAEKEKKNGLKK